jgi:hypothetical protein
MRPNHLHPDLYRDPFPIIQYFLSPLCPNDITHPPNPQAGWMRRSNFNNDTQTHTYSPEHRSVGVLLR